MERLRNAGYDLYVVSNGSEEMLDSMIDHGDLDEFLSGTVSADEIEQFKPEPEIYRHAADRIGTPTEGIAFVASGWWDVPGGLTRACRASGSTDRTRCGAPTRWIRI